MWSTSRATCSSACPSMTVPSAVLTTMVSASTAKLTGTTTGPETVPNAIRPTPPGVISRRHLGRRQLADEPHVGQMALAGRRVRARAEQRGAWSAAPRRAA